MRKLLTKILSVIVAVTATLGLVMLPKTAVQASEFTFGAVAGASVKYGDTVEETGLRFTIEVDKEFYASLAEGVEFGALISTANYASSKELVIGDDMVANVCYVTDETKFDLEAVSENFVYYASITYTFNDEWKADVVEKFASTGLSEDEIFAKAKLQAMATELICRPYYKIGEEVVYAELSDARSMVKVANGAVIDGETLTDDFVAKYLSTLTEVDAYVSTEGEIEGMDGLDLDGATFTADGNAGDIEFDVNTYFADKTVGEYYYVTAFKGYDVYRVKFLYATKLINEASDLSVFVLTGGTEGTAALGHDGYYVLTKDIDATGYVHGTHTFTSGGTTYPGSSDKGFKGTLDGNGYTISNFASINNGLFGQASAPVVKNISFTNVSIAGYYGSLFAHSINRDGWIEGQGYTKEALFENVYIQIDKVTFGGSKRVGVLANNTMPLSIRVNNVVVEYTNAKADGVYDNVYALTHEFAIFGGSNGADMQKTLTFENAYAITDLPVMYTRGTRPYAAENQVEHTISNGYWIATVGAILDEGYADFLTAKGITLDVHMVARDLRYYADYSAMASDSEATAEKLATIDSTYWIVVNGVPYWKSLYSEMVDLVIEDRDDNVVNPSDIVLNDAKTEYEVKLVDGSHAISGIEIEGEGLFVDGNKFRLAEEPVGEGTIEVVVTAIVNGATVTRTFTVTYSNVIALNGKVLYSKDDLALDLPSLQKAGVEISSLEEIDGYVVGEETVDVLDLEVIISNYTTTNKGRDRSIDTAQEVRFTVGNKLYVLSNVYAYTKLIDEAEDLKVFTLKGATEENPYNEVDGYFLVTKNIDASALELDAHTFMSGAVYPGNGVSADVGFRGVFDGQGYTIDGLTTKSCGLFATMNAPVVKNIAFTNANIGGYYTALFAQSYTRGKDYNNNFNNLDGLFENVYVSVNSIDYYNSNGSIGVFVYGTLPGTVNLENVIVEYEVESYTQTKIEAGSQFYMIGSTTGSMASSTDRFVNCYSISTAPVLQRTAMPGFAENQVEYTLTGNKVTAVGNVLDEQVNEVLTRCGKTLTVDHVLVGLRAYDNYEALAADDSDRNVASLATFSSDYWLVKNGVPYWIESYKQSFVAQVKEGDKVVDGDIVLNSAKTELTLNIVDKGGNAVEGVEITAPEGIVVDGNVIKLASEPSSTGSYEVKLTATVDGLTIEKWITVKYTNVIDVDGKVLYSQIDKALDLTTLNAAGVDIESLEDIDGYIVQGEEAEVLELEVIISNKTEKRVVDTAQAVSAKVGNKVYNLNNVYAYTLLIDEISDMDVLSAPVDTVLANGYVVLDENAGYYLLTKNVSGAGLGTPDKEGNPTDYQLAGNLNSVASRSTGLTGVFDGNGYTISNAIVPSRGIFTFIKGGLVKDIGFKNMTLAGYYSCLLAHQFTYKGSNTVDTTAWVTNLYVENTNVSYTSSNGDYGLLFQNQLYGKVQNFVVKHTLNDTEKAKMRAGKRSGLFASQYNYYPTTGSVNAHLKNWIVIGDLPVAYDNSTNKSWNKFVLGKNMLKTNEDGELELINPTAFAFVNELFTQTTGEGEEATRIWSPVYNTSTDTIHTIDEAQFVRQYIDDAALVADKAGCADILATFTSPYWVVGEDGSIAWASAVNA